jgi:selenocysteine lyase/cysteine desulfurase
VGIEAIAARLHVITSRLIAGLLAKGFQVVSPRQPGEESGIVSFVSPRGGHEALARTLRQDHHVELAIRAGRLRCAPHFYNTDQQIDRLIELLPAH